MKKILAIAAATILSAAGCRCYDGWYNDGWDTYGDPYHDGMVYDGGYEGYLPEGGDYHGYLPEGGEHPVYLPDGATMIGPQIVVPGGETIPVPAGEPLPEPAQ